MTFSAAASSSVPQLGWSQRYISQESESAWSCRVVINTPLTEPGSSLLRSTINIIINHAARSRHQDSCHTSNRALAVLSRTDCWVADWVSSVYCSRGRKTCYFVAVLQFRGSSTKLTNQHFLAPSLGAECDPDHLSTRFLRRGAAVLQCCRHNLGHVPIIARANPAPTLAG